LLHGRIGRCEKNNDMWDRLLGLPFSAAMRTLFMPALLLQLAVDALRGHRFLLLNGWQLLRAYGYKLSNQDWWALYGVHYMAGQESLGRAALVVGGVLLLLYAALWAAIGAGLLRLLARLRNG